MSNFYENINPELAEFIAAQPMYFVATAPKSGRINLSPKGQTGSFAVLNPTQVAMLNLTGSGNETAAHLLDDDRITLMFCSFGRKPMILRLYGTGRSVYPRDPEWQELTTKFADLPAKRQIVVVDIHSVMTSCGYAVPQMDLVEERQVLNNWAATKDEEAIKEYWKQKNVQSIDGLPTGLFDPTETSAPDAFA